MGAASLAAHSFIDGIAIGLAFQVSPAVGAVVAAAVLAHDFSDGVNTVGVVLRNGASTKKATAWLAVDALAPVLGILASYSLKVADHVLGLLLAVFCGFFLYLGASDLLPESHHRHPQLITSLMTIAGAVVIYVAIRISGL